MQHIVCMCVCIILQLLPVLDISLLHLAIRHLLLIILVISTKQHHSSSGDQATDYCYMTMLLCYSVVLILYHALIVIKVKGRQAGGGAAFLIIRINDYS